MNPQEKLENELWSITKEQQIGEIFAQIKNIAHVEVTNCKSCYVVKFGLPWPTITEL